MSEHNHSAAALHVRMDLLLLLGAPGAGETDRKRWCRRWPSSHGSWNARLFSDSRRRGGPSLNRSLSSEPTGQNFRLGKFTVGVLKSSSFAKLEKED